jgi:raffinose/stachyose/melibiose transport system permease protein
VLSLFGLGEVNTAWLGSPTSALWWIAIMTAWQFSGYTMVIYLSGLQEVPPSQLEAAAIDGAGPVRTFWSIVRPLLGPAFTINLVLSTIRALMIFDMIWVTTQGGPANTTNSLGTLIFRDAFQFQQFGYSLAAAVILSLLVAVASVVQYVLTSRQKQSR